MAILEWFQWKTTEMINCCICHVTSAWKSCSACRNFRGYLIIVYKHLTGRCKEDEARFFSKVPSDRTTKNVHKLKERIFHLNIRKSYFTMRVIQLWNRTAEFVLGDIQCPPGHSPEQPVWLGFEQREWTKWSRDTIQCLLYITLRFCAHVSLRNWV